MKSILNQLYELEKRFSREPDFSKIRDAAHLMTFTTIFIKNIKSLIECARALETYAEMSAEHFDAVDGGEIAREALAKLNNESVT